MTKNLPVEITGITLEINSLKDVERAVSVVISKDIINNLTLSLEYMRRDNMSNIALYDYEKNLYSMGLSWRW